MGIILVDEDGEKLKAVTRAPNSGKMQGMVSRQ